MSERIKLFIEAEIYTLLPETEFFNTININLPVAEILRMT